MRTRTPRPSVMVNVPPARRPAGIWIFPALALLTAMFIGVSGSWRVPFPGRDTGVQTGYASWYGPNFHGLATAQGEPFDMFSLTAAHPTLPLGTRVRVRNLENGRSVVVRINDRGPYRRDGKNVVIDLSWRAARDLGMARNGLAQVEVAPLPP